MQSSINFPDKSKGYICGCCGQFVKLYSRSFNSNMAVAALVLYRNRDKGFVHLENLLSEQGYKRCGDASYLKHYRIIEKMEGDRPDGSNRNGYYKLTGTGILFCENKLSVKEKFLMFNNKCEGFEGNEINIVQALKNKFDYNELMKCT